MRGIYFSALVALAAVSCHGPRVQLVHPVAPQSSVTDPTFRQSLSGEIRSSFLGGNKVTPLVNGTQYFPAMLEAIRRATNSVNMETFIWKSGEMSDGFINALTERARAGVEVRVIADGLGTLNLDDADLERLRSAGVEFARYNKPRLHLLNRVNFRDHRKLLIVDGVVGFTGGACVGDAWLGNAETKDVWRDTHFKVEGPVVSQIQGAFGANWLKSRGEMLFGPKFYPVLEEKGGTMAQNFTSGPQDGGENARMVYMAAIAAAKKRIVLSHSYFVPDDLALKELIRARERGVDVQVLTPGNIDANIVRRASRTLWPQLLRAGVRMYEYGPAMLHCKILVVDGYLVSCGSVNFDERSFKINDESNINILDEQIAARLIADFEKDKAQSREVHIEDVKEAPWYMRTFEKFTSWFRPQL